MKSYEKSREEAITKISIDGKEVEYIDLINADRYDLCNEIDNYIDELRDLPTQYEAERGIEFRSDYGTVRVWEEMPKWRKEQLEKVAKEHHDCGLFDAERILLALENDEPDGLDAVCLVVHILAKKTSKDK